MRTALTAITLLATAVLLAGQASAGVLYLSASATNPSPGVPEWNLNIGDSTTLYMWFQLSANEIVNGLAIDLICDSPGVVISTGSVTVPNPVVNGNTRWNAGKVNGSTGLPNMLINGMRLFAITENGIDGSFGSLDSTCRVGDSYRVASVTITAQTVGITRVWITTGPDGGISYPVGHEGDPARTCFGMPDDEIDPRQGGVTGTQPDAIIYSGIPEPTTLSLLTIGGLFLIRRR